jgi:phage baseplate assembly protein V
MTRRIRGIVSSVVAEAGKLVRMTIDGLTGERIDDVETLGQYGFSSRPRAGAEAIAEKIGSGYVVVETADRRYTIPLADGDVAMHTSDGQYIKLLAAGGIDVKSTGTVSVDAGTVQLGGTSGLRKLIDERLVALFNAHTHAANGSPPATQIVAANVTTANTKAI